MTPTAHPDPDRVDSGSAPAVWSSSGGKDSLLALWHAKRLGMRPATMLTMFEETGLRSRSHGISQRLMELQAQALGLELVMPAASWADYEKVFVQALRLLRESNHRTAIFGDIDLQAHRDWEERVCSTADLQACLPLWHRDRRELAEESIGLRFRSIVVCTDSRYLSDEFCGREFDARFIADLPPGVDPCGENGEFHTFVYDGPLFRQALSVQVQSKEAYVAPPQLGGVRYCFARLE
jgi:uncharacterized protein (TIGR00290 family)